MMTVPGVSRWSLARTVMIAPLFAAALSACATVDGPRRGEVLLFAPSVASVSGQDGSLLVQGRISAPLSEDRQRLVHGFAEFVGAKPDNPLYRERMGALISDSKRKVRVAVNVRGKVQPLQPSDPAGYVTGDVPLTEAQVAELARTGRISFDSVPTAANSSRFSGDAVLVSETGFTVVTDMDDTIKVTNIRDHAEAKANTFVRPFTAVPGMPHLYRGWEREFGSRIHFHVVSAGPWQFHDVLRRFTIEANFPDFTWDMRSVDLPNPLVAFNELIRADLKRLYVFKRAKIGDFMKRFPQRHVVLVGDSGECDPEVYADILRDFPDRVDAVFIRNVHEEKDKEDQAKRYEKLFSSDAMKAKLRVFREPADLPPLSQMVDSK